jgi:hypothetical protein
MDWLAPVSFTATTGLFTPPPAMMISIDDCSFACGVVSSADSLDRRPAGCSFHDFCTKKRSAIYPNTITPTWRRTNRLLLLFEKYWLGKPPADNSELIATVTSISKSNANSIMSNCWLNFRNGEWRWDNGQEAIVAGQDQDHSLCGSDLLAARALRSVYKKHPKKEKEKKRSKKASRALCERRRQEERESVCVCPDSSFTLDKIFDVERISSRPWSEERERERERESRECTKREKRKGKKQKYVALWSVNDEGREKGQKRGWEVPLLMLNLSGT